MGELIGIRDVRAAAERIGDHVVRTPTVPSPGLSAHLDAPVSLKLELLQRTGSFKPRGALHKLLSLSDAERTAGVVAVSGGKPRCRGRRRRSRARCRGHGRHAGVGARAVLPGVRIWGVETEGADAMSGARTAGGPVPIELPSIVTALSAPAVSPLIFQHVSTLVEDVIVVSDADAVRGTLTLAEEAKLWTEPAASCLVQAARRLLDRLGPGVRLGLVVCGGNVTAADVRGWVDRFGD